MMKKAIAAIGIFGVILTGVSCKKDKADPNEGELITTVKVKLTDKTSNIVTEYVFRDLDGEGGLAPSQFDQIQLGKGKPYDCMLTILNESVSPADDITAEVLAEADDHEFYFTPTNGLATVSNLSKDSKGLPVGITSTWVAGANAGTGNINITLKHKPGSKAQGDPITKGETDISLDFVLKVN
jgi:hypothetical protein